MKVSIAPTLDSCGKNEGAQQDFLLQLKGGFFLVGILISEGVIITLRMSE